MGQVDWHIVKDVFYTALNRSAEERADFLRSACGENNALRSEVEFLLESYESGFLESPILADASASALADKPLFEQGQQFSHYQILRLIGRGGMGEVYLADDLALDRLCAIKVIHRDSGFGEQAADRLIREARSAAKLDHPNICSVYEVGEVEGEPYIAMQYVEGEMLDSIIARDPIELMDAVSYTRQIAAALSKSHSWGIVHRDIKPSNIIVDANGQVKVLDFGLAKATHVDASDINLSTVGLIAGTVTYMSPEHARGQEINGQTDVWSLGVVFFQLLTGRLPFRGENKADLISSILNDDVDLPSELPAEINYILGRALEKDREKRYPSIEEFESDLNEFAESGSVKRSLGYNFPDRSRTTGSTSLPIAQSTGIFSRYTLMAALLFIVFGSGFGLWWYRAANAPRQPFSSAAAENLLIKTIYDLKRDVSGVIYGLQFSPDGTKIAFSQSGSSGHAIYVKSIDGGEPMRLTFERTATSPLWSADGQRIAYRVTKDGSSSIFSVSADGGEPVFLADVSGAIGGDELKYWSSDGKRIYLMINAVPSVLDLETNSLTTVDLAGIESETKQYYSISPDETKIMAMSYVGGQKKLWLKSLRANDARCIAESFDGFDAPDWFPDNHRFTYSKDVGDVEQIFVGSLDGADPKQLTFGSENATNPVVSPTGDRISFVSSTNEANLFTTDIASHTETVITSNTRMNVLPAFTSDGRVIYHSIPQVAAILQSTIKIRSINGEEPPGESVLAESAGFGRLSPNGDEIAFIKKAGNLRNIFKTGINGQSEKQVTTGGIHPGSFSVAPIDLHFYPLEWSPDGSSITYVKRTNGQENIWTVSAEGTAEKAITNFSDGKTKAVAPKWSPNGDRIAFLEAVGVGPYASAKEFRVSIYGNDIITVFGGFNYPTILLGWANDGNGVYVAVKSEQGFDIYRVPTDGTVSRRKLQLPNARQLSMRISPDQRWIVYTVRGDEVDNLYLVPMTGGEPRRVTANNDTTLYYSGVTWSPDSRTLLYSKQTGGLQISLISDIQEEGH
ncbi:MAG: serine/threonine-protein kinase [Pyrinomonadaceae bacterium]|nr:serine/threonine-protein kinase [Pyrinomonadaceae bacterium]MBP6213331.1 serine/threonine-protein kinase [Pyrinomonadaceae bacterium]